MKRMSVKPTNEKESVTMDNTSAMAEWQLWRDLTAMLLEVGAVTKDDCHQPISARGTNGQRMFAAIRGWGKAYAKLAADSPQVLDN
jgi:hypothetical protein